MPYSSGRARSPEIAGVAGGWWHGSDCRAATWSRGQRVEPDAGVRTLAGICAVPEATPGRLISGVTEERVDSTSKRRAWEIEAHQVLVTVWLAGGGGRGWGQRVLVRPGMASR